MTQGQLAYRIKVSPATVSRWLSGGRPDPEYCGRLAKFFEVPIEEVYAAAGPPADYVPPERQELSPKDAILEALADFPVAVPVQEQLVSAGEGRTASMDRIYLAPAKAAGRNIIAVRVRGFSMEPTISEGDTIIVDRDAAAQPNDIVVATVGDNVYVKRLARKLDTFVLAGTNGTIIPADEATIIGKVIQVIREL